MDFIYSKMQKQLIFTALEYTMTVLGVLFQCPKVSPFLHFKSLVAICQQAGFVFVQLIAEQFSGFFIHNEGIGKRETYNYIEGSWRTAAAFHAFVVQAYGSILHQVG